jgi:hypothetical protein
MSNKPLLIGASFPTAEDVRNMKSKSQKRLEELQALTATFIKEDLRKKIVTSQENDCAGCNYKETTWFEYPEFLKTWDEQKQFVEMLSDTLSPLGYKVYAETDGALEPTKNVIVTWKVQTPTPRKPAL